MSKKHITFFIIIFFSITIAFMNMKNIISPYFSFNEAIESEEQCQIIGKLDKQIKLLNSNNFFSFYLTNEKNQKIKVSSKNPKLFNFDHSEKIVAIGKFDKKNNIFKADKLLLKCPSKYIKEKNLPEN